MSEFEWETIMEVPVDGAGQLDLFSWAKWFEDEAAENVKNPAHRVYIMQGGGFVKVGISIDVETRFQKIQDHLPFDAELVASFAGSRRAERRILTLLSKERTRGEWFSGPVAQRLIDKLKSLGPAEVETYLKTLTVLP